MDEEVLLHMVGEGEVEETFVSRLDCEKQECHHQRCLEIVIPTEEGDVVQRYCTATNADSGGTTQRGEQLDAPITSPPTESPAHLYTTATATAATDCHSPVVSDNGASAAVVHGHKTRHRHSFAEYDCQYLLDAAAVLSPLKPVGTAMRFVTRGLSAVSSRCFSPNGVTMKYCVLLSIASGLVYLSC